MPSIIIIIIFENLNLTSNIREKEKIIVKKNNLKICREKGSFFFVIYGIYIN